VTTQSEFLRLRGYATAVRRPGFIRTVARTATFNISSAVVAGVGGLLIARVLGPTVRGEYAAITSWLGIVLMVGGMGQPVALCFYVARDPLRARDYVGTSRAMMMTTGAVALAIGLVIAPLLARGRPAEELGYRIAFGTAMVSLVGFSYVFSLQARAVHRLNLVQISQPLLSLAAVGVAWRLGRLTLDSAIVILVATTFLQLCWAYYHCRRVGLVPGHVRTELVRPLAAYGASQIAAQTPAALNAYLDQLVLSVTVPPADLGRYAIAVSLTLLPVPLVTAIGIVAFPRLAARQGTAQEATRLQRTAVAGSIGLAAALLLPLAAVAYWLVPFVFGAAYRGAVPLLWILAPGAVFLACGQVVGDMLRGRGHVSVVAWAEGLAAICTVALLIVLLPLVGVYGAAIASTISYGVAFAVMVRRLWRLPRHSRGSGPRPPAPPRRLASHRSAPPRSHLRGAS
jgi:O-antigen/teichoic acid export membrane protein